MAETVLFNFPELVEPGIRVEEELEHGTYARVYKAFFPRENKYVAVKRQLIQTGGHNKYEIEILNDLGDSSPYIPQLIDMFLDRESQTYSLILPYFDHVPFSTCLSTMGLAELQLYAKNLFQSLVELHDDGRGYVHRDIKPGNFLYVRGEDDGPNRYILLDFGLAEKIEFLKEDHKKYAIAKDQQRRSKRAGPRDETGQFVKPVQPRAPRRPRREGTRGFRAPEVLFGSFFQDEAMDVWAAGILIASIATGAYPVFGSPDDDTDALFRLAHILGTEELENAARRIKVYVKFVNNTKWDYTAEKTDMETFLHKSCRDEFKHCPELFSMLAAALKLVPWDRPSARNLLSHPFFQLRLATPDFMG